MPCMGLERLGVRSQEGPKVAGEERPGALDQDGASGPCAGEGWKVHGLVKGLRAMGREKGGEGRGAEGRGALLCTQPTTHSTTNCAGSDATVFRSRQSFVPRRSPACSNPGSVPRTPSSPGQVSRFRYRDALPSSGADQPNRKSFTDPT